MAGIAFLIFVAATLCVGMFVRYRKRPPKPRVALSDQIEHIKQLNDQLHHRTFNLLPPFSSGHLHSMEVSLADIAGMLEGDNELSKEKYDEMEVYTLESTFTLFPGADLESLPKKIREEIEPFIPAKIVIAKPGTPSCFMISNRPGEFRGIQQAVTFSITQAEAFENWLTFKECSHNLLYVVRQWLSEQNADAPRKSESAYA